MTTNSHQYKDQINTSQKPLSLSHTHACWGPLASDSPQWNFHAAIWRSIGERDLLSGLDVPVEKTRKLEHIGSCKSEGKEKSSWILPLLLLTIWSFSIGKSLCVYVSVWESVSALCGICVKVQLSRYCRKTVEVLTPILCHDIMKEMEEMGPLNWPQALEKQPTVRGKVTVIVRQLCSDVNTAPVNVCVLHCTVNSRYSWFCVVFVISC